MSNNCNNCKYYLPRMLSPYHQCGVYFDQQIAVGKVKEGKQGNCKDWNEK